MYQETKRTAGGGPSEVEDEGVYLGVGGGRSDASATKYFTRIKGPPDFLRNNPT